MAISKGNQTKEIQEYKRYIGVAPVFIKAVNPTKAEHEAIFNTSLEDSPVYVTDAEDANGNSYKNARIQIVMQLAKEKYPSENREARIMEDYNNPDGVKISMTMFIQNKLCVGATSGKTKVIDKYGRTAWATPEELASHSIPMYANGPAEIDKDYRPAYVGEEELTNLVRVFLDIPTVTVYDNNTQKRILNPKAKPEECECRLEHVDKMFKGDFTEIKEIMGMMPLNRIKVLLGVRTDIESGKLYQAVYTKKFLSNPTRNYKALADEIENMNAYATANGRTVNTEYEAVPVHEYTVTPTTFTPTETASSDMPFEPAEDNLGLPW